jgi:adenylate cyclase
MSAVMRAVKDLGGPIAAVLGKISGRWIDRTIAAVVTLAGLVVFAFVGIGADSRAAFSFLHNIEQRSLDARFKLRGKRTPDARVVIVGIDEKTLQKVGAWPIPRDAYAKLIDNLSAGGAKTVALDVTFPNPEKNSAMDALRKLESQVASLASPAVVAKIREIERTSDNDVIFAESMKKADNVILGHVFLDKERSKAIDPKATEDYFNILWGKPFPQVRKVTGGRDFDMNAVWADSTSPWGVIYGAEANIRVLAEAARSYGFFNYVADGDGTFRRAPFLMRYQDRDFFPSLPLQTVREYENIKDQSIEGFIGPNGLERIEFGPYKLDTGHDGRMLINYAGPYQTYAHYSMGDVIDGTVPAATFKDKIVLVGATAVGIGDLRVTPFQSGDYMGVEIHANVIDNLLHSGEKGSGFLTRGLNEEMIDLAFILLFGVGMGLVFGRLKPLLATASVVAVTAIFVGLNYFAFARWGMWLSFVVPVGVLVANYASITSYRAIFEEREKRKIRKTFAQYVSPGIIRLIEKDPKKYFHVGGKLKELTIMFTDICSFTSISEELTPDQLVSLLNEYLGDMTEILFHRWGTLDKYIGDALMAFWGSPFPQEDHYIRACACALDMQARLEELNFKWEAEGRKQLQIGIGINTGQVTVGNMGSSKRLAWTVMGDHVNLASRLEGLTRAYQVRNIISENTFRMVSAQFACRELDRIRVKGKLQPVIIYELLDFKKNEGRWTERVGLFNEAMAAYRRHKWDEAIQKFEAVLAKYPDDGPSEVFWQRAQEFRREAPAPDWDGVYVMKTK